MSTGNLLATGIKRAKDITNKTLADFSDAEMLHRPTKAANHTTWQLGHLTQATWHMAAAIDPSVKLPVADDRFTKETSTSDDVSKFPKKAEVMIAFNNAMDAAMGAAGKLQEADLDKPGPERMRNFLPTVGDVAIMLGAHPMMHIGQFQVIRRSLAKPLVL